MCPLLKKSPIYYLRHPIMYSCFPAPLIETADPQLRMFIEGVGAVKGDRTPEECMWPGRKVSARALFTGSCCIGATFACRRGIGYQWRTGAGDMCQESTSLSIESSARVLSSLFQSLPPNNALALAGRGDASSEYC